MSVCWSLESVESGITISCRSYDGLRGFWMGSDMVCKCSVCVYNGFVIIYEVMKRFYVDMECFYEGL